MKPVLDSDLTSPPAADGAQRWIVFGVICLVYFLVYFHRVSTSVIVTDLLAAFNTNATALSFMSSMYFYLYAFEQPVVGYLADRFGPRRVIGWWSMIAAAGCFIFAAAPNIAVAAIGRGLIGIGVGGVYVPALKALALWFRQKEFAGMLGVLMSVGNVGAVIATTPLAWAAATWGWRSSFVLIGVVTLALAVITLLKTRDHAGSTPAPVLGADKSAPARGGLRVDVTQVLASGQFWISAVLFFGCYGTLLTLQGLWATPFLMTALEIGRLQASKLNMLIPIGVIIGSPLLGWLSDRFALNKRRLQVAILSGYAITWFGMIFFPTVLGAIGLGTLQLIMGALAGGFVTIAWAIVRENTPARLMGLTSGLLNPSPFLGVAVFQVLTGTILDQAGIVGGLYPLEGFRNAFLTCLAANIVCLGLSLVMLKSDARKNLA
jgi:sugar phosphate permease